MEQFNLIFVYSGIWMAFTTFLAAALTIFITFSFNKDKLRIIKQTQENLLKTISNDENLQAKKSSFYHLFFQRFIYKIFSNHIRIFRSDFKARIKYKLMQRVCK